MDLLVEFPSNPGGSSHQLRSRGHRPERRGRSGELMPFPRTPPAARSRLGVGQELVVLDKLELGFFGLQEALSVAAGS